MEHIYADHAATTRLDGDALEAMLPWLQDAYGNASQLYSFARKPKQAIREARRMVAACIHAQPEEIFFTSGGTESDNWVIKGSALSDPTHRPTVTSAFEHHAILNACRTIERLGYPVTYLRPSAEGQISPALLEHALSGETRLVSIMFANNEIGSIQPIQKLCTVAHSHGALFHTDAVQAVGHVDLDVQILGVDFLSASAHKFCGPKGVGFLYIRKGVPLASYIDGGAQESGLRAGTENVASIVGMAVALRKSCVSVQEQKAHLQRLETSLLSRLAGARIRFQRNGGTERLPGLISLSFPGKDGEAILHRMDLMGISISTGSACNSKDTAISHVLRSIGLDDTLAGGTIRISLGKENTVTEVNKIADALIRILR
ncbi:cysteine desulfurase family protein [Pseudoflavonifractor phocaeensis]|uniref:cysteine desulfurase family protein n=1 Tax=Pseudoflavonifractor phocaeensis TaxID=1870988 RepID=UPI001958F39C|nr:cysteine desulfurase family protein [Pseudoflavonifractor phocaeensis]MBM6926376.1 cysteine desulfurase [Pseudoflavonifractor phocaeensis]